MIKFRAIIIGTGKEFEPKCIYCNGTIIHPNGNRYPKGSYILRMGVQIGGVRHYENDLFDWIDEPNFDHEYFYIISNIYMGFRFMEINQRRCIGITNLKGMKKIGHLWTPGKIQELVKKYDPPVYSCFKNLGPFSKVMK